MFKHGMWDGVGRVQTGVERCMWGVVLVQWGAAQLFFPAFLLDSTAILISSRYPCMVRICPLHLPLHLSQLMFQPELEG